MAELHPLHGLSHVALAVSDLDRTVDFRTRVSAPETGKLKARAP